MGCLSAEGPARPGNECAGLSDANASGRLANMGKKRKDVAVGVLLNFFIPGAGYVYAERYVIAVFVFMLLAGGIALTLVAPPLGTNLVGLLAIVGAVDGYLTVKKYNQRIDEAEQATLIACPSCAEKIQATARVCRFCHRETSPAQVGA